MEEAAPSFPGGLLQDCDHLTLTPAIGEDQELSRRLHSSLGLRGLPQLLVAVASRETPQGPLGWPGHLERGLVGPQGSPCVRVWGACLADPTSLPTSCHSLHLAPVACLFFHFLPSNREVRLRGATFAGMTLNLSPRGMGSGQG